MNLESIIPIQIVFPSSGPTDVKEKKEFLTKQIIRDSGDDLQLSPDDLALLYLGTFDGDWSKVFFSFDELLAYYNAKDPIEPHQYPAVVFASLACSLSLKHGAGDWDFSFDKILKVFLKFKGIIDCDTRTYHIAKILELR